MTLTQQFLTILSAAVATSLTRFLPFWTFPSKAKTPKFIVQLGDLLPPAILGMLVVYSFKDQLLVPNMDLLFAGIAGLATVLIHLWRQNMMLSILVGTVIYMVLVNFTGG